METEAVRGDTHAVGHPADLCQRQNLNPGSLAPESCVGDSEEDPGS